MQGRMPMRTLLLIVILQILAFWPVWRWYVSRVITTSGDEYALLALGTALVMLWCRRPQRSSGTVSLRLPIVMMLLYGALCWFVPPELRAAIALSSLAVTLSMVRGQRFPELGIVGLFLLSLPLIPSLQFYLGYPMRVLVAQFAVPVLRLGGYAVVREGACLSWGDTLVWIDAPCSGIRMLWVGGYLLFTLSLIYRLSSLRTFIAGLSAFGLILAANVLRSASLFYLEADIVALPAFAHEAVGIVVFCLLSAAIFLLVRRLHEGQSDGQTEMTEPDTRPAAPDCAGNVVPLKSVSFCMAVILFAGVMPILPLPAATHKATEDNFPGWREEWEGRSLTMLDLSPREKALAAKFPGRTARFTDGRREIIMRWVTAPTRRLHPASDCFRAHGAKLKALPLYIDARGTKWGSFEVTQDGRRLLVREQFCDNAGQTWSDVSSWYWSAMLGKTQGPWWVLVVVENLNGSPKQKSST
jgi:exosortase/archaeosortase family protein